MNYLRLPVIWLLILFCGYATAQQPPLDIVDKVIIAQFRDHNTEVLCLNEQSSLPTIKAVVEARLQQLPAGSAQSQDAIAKAVYTLFPCPFSPYRKELRPASQKDIEGVWLFPEASQKFRYGPKSRNWTALRQQPVRCEAVAYYPDGEARGAQMSGAFPCPFKAAQDMDGSRKNPKVASWKIQSDGRLAIERTDIPDHIEEWEVFIVTSPLQLNELHFEVGDMVQFLRREKGNEFNVATMFRHLQRLH